MPMNKWIRQTHMESMEEQGGGGDRVEGTAQTGRTESTQSMVLAYKRRRRGKGPVRMRHSGILARCLHDFEHSTNQQWTADAL